MMVGKSRKRISSSVFYALPTIGLVFLSHKAHSWIPAKSMTHHGLVTPQNQYISKLKSFKGETQDSPWIDEQLTIPITARERKSDTARLIEELQLTFQLFVASVGMSVILISWEDVSMYHPMRMESQALLSTSTSSSQSQDSTFAQEFPLRWGRSTIRGLAAGGNERRVIAEAGDLESSTYKDLPSYNEVMLTHRTDRIPLWNPNEKAFWNPSEKDTVVPTTQKDVTDSVRAIQMALLRIRDCTKLAQNYEWDDLIEVLGEKVLRSDLESACYILKGADEFLSKEARDEIGFDWGSCAWRHCGALSDAQEAIDALEHQVGMLEPFECVYCLDVIERSLRDMLAVTNKYADKSVKIPDYVPIQRMSDLSNQDDSALDRQDEEYMSTLSFLRNMEF